MTNYFIDLLQKQVIVFVNEIENNKEKTYKYEGLLLTTDNETIEIKDIKVGYLFIPIKKIISIREV